MRSRVDTASSTGALSALALTVMSGCGTGGDTGAQGGDGRPVAASVSSGPWEGGKGGGGEGAAAGSGGAGTSAGAGGAGTGGMGSAAGTGGMGSAAGTGGMGSAAGTGGMESAAGTGGTGAAEGTGGMGAAAGTGGAGSGGGPSIETDRLPAALALSGDIQGVHDPSIVRAGELYHVFSTGPGIAIRTSADLVHWSLAGSVFSATPEWVASAVGDVDALWAPDISFWGGLYHLYYAASFFGTNRSCIGHATRDSLQAPESRWLDHGAVVCSEGTDYNAIDPNVVIDERGTPWLVFGSFWSGLKLMQLTLAGAPVAGTLTSIASRPSTAIEAPFIVRRGEHYYLFASFDTCCTGASSTYKIMVGRSQALAGPYVDRLGNRMLDGGGSRVLTSSARWRGPGSNGLIRAGESWYNIYHSYDADADGMSVLRIAELSWDTGGWPESGGP
ncbi:arabinan endo-1,5-alpha-L-arabinosidase [Sorangium sp. So ce1153]|uniref:arabinan endo-1,5-alpha-L-arabinosidase n=1 Tax=Sorangium sp. So ce1153 TaxID=3133333 RepID=UPI003F6462AB